jgi:hypothetical protein
MQSDNIGVQKVPPYSQFSAELADALQRCADTYLDEFDEHHAFDYLVAELFATTNAPQFVFTDGSNDSGIDFFVKQGPSYLICQCKCSDFDILKNSATAPTFDDNAVDELTSAVRMLIDPEGTYKLSSKIRMLRTDYQRDLQEDPEARLLTATVAVAGALTPSAKTKFGSEKAALRKVGVTLQLVTWEDLYHKLHFQELNVDDIKIELECDDVKNALLRYQDYCYVLARAHSFYGAFRLHEWNLFDWNVRLQLTSSPINAKIVRTLEKEKTRKRFHHYNNGVLIVCKHYQVDEKRNIVRINGAQIVNGCQTVRAICEAYDQLEPNEQKSFREFAKVQVKIIRGAALDFISELTITTNDQNPMNQRNLKSNTPEQKGIQNGFRGMRPSPWFYERKDGEFKSLMASTTSGRWFRKSDYSAEKGRFRKIGNEELAKAWYAFIGHSDEVVRGGIDFFQTEEAYTQIFKRAPNSKFWSAYAQNASFVASEEYFDNITPSAYAYLLVYSINQYIRSKTISSRQNKQSAIERGRQEGKIKGNAEDQIIAFLVEDADYRINIMMSNMKDILTELFGLVLASKYGEINAQLASRLLNFPEVIEYLTSGFLPEKGPSSIQDGTRVFGPTYEFLRYCSQQFFFANRAEIQAAARLKSYLWQRKIVVRMKENLLKLDELVRDYDVNWKQRGKSFLESLP